MENETGVKTESYTAQIWDLIESCVMTAVPMNQAVYQKLQDARWLRPDKPTDDVAGYLAFESGADKPRMKLKTGRFLTRKLDLQTVLFDSQIRDLAADINKLLWPDGLMEFLSGKAITEAYRQAVGTTSCMTGNNADCTALYAMNPGRFRLMVCRRNGDSGRAIIHKLDNGEFLLDRCYASSDDVSAEMRDYAELQGWYVRRDDGRVYKGGSALQSHDVLTVSGLEWEEGGIPYMDTLQWGSLCSGLLDLSYDSGDCNLTQTDGTLEYGVECAACGRNFDNENEGAWVGDYIYCGRCLDRNFTWCDHCEEYRDNDSCVTIEDESIYVCEDCARDYYFYCEECQKWYADDARVYVEDADVDVCQDCAESNYHLCNDCGRWCANGDMVNDQFHCEVCRDKYFEKCEGCGEYTEDADENSLCPDCQTKDDETESETETEIESQHGEIAA